MSQRQRGIFEKVRGSGVWWICWFDQFGRRHREKAGAKSGAIALYWKRKTEALQGRKLPEKMRQRPAMFREIAQDMLNYSKAYKRSYVDDRCRVSRLLGWFGEHAADSIDPQEIERRLEQAAREEGWAPATINRYRALLSLIYKLAIRNRKVKENPARLVPHRAEHNGRVRFLSPEEECQLRTAIEENFPDHLPEFDLALHAGPRLSEQYGARWEDVDFEHRVLTLPRTKNGETRRVRLNSTASSALMQLRRRNEPSGLVCGGARSPRGWFERALKIANIRDFTWHCLRHTFASRLVMSGTDLRTVAELLGHRTLQMVMRYAHLAPDYQLAAVERMETAFASATRTATMGHGSVERKPSYVH